ncbi:hypothetical protein QP157_17090 [Sphingomonas sp. LR61]|uniref:hypothetical protein n=1 Tax=Sphingomonas sp. LR61 TaxID=3050234 RepID=UPI002FE2A7CC
MGRAVRPTHGRRRSHRVPVQPPDERDGADRRPRGRARPRQGPGRRPDRRVRRRWGVAPGAAGGGSRVIVRTPSPDQLFQAIGPNATVTPREDGTFLVVGPDAPTVGNIAAQAGVALHELTPTGASLEEAYMALTRDDVEYRSEGTR